MQIDVHILSTSHIEPRVGVDAKSANVQADVQCFGTTVGWIDVLTATERKYL